MSQTGPGGGSTAGHLVNHWVCAVLHPCYLHAGLVADNVTAAAAAQQKSKEGGLAGGAIAGIVLGALAACVLASALAFVLFRRKRSPAGSG